jgi:Spy/CpxP family protein refolding chaperone
MKTGMGGMTCPKCGVMMQHPSGGCGGGMQGGMGMMGMLMKLHWKLAMMGERFGLSEDQKKAIHDKLVEMKKQGIRTKADIAIDLIDLKGLTMREDVNMADVEAKIRELAKLKGDLWLGRIKGMQEMKQVLTPEQRANIKKMFMAKMHKMSGMEEEEGEEEGEEAE